MSWLWGGVSGNTYVARSNLQPLALPTKAIGDMPINQFPLTVITGDSPLPAALSFPSGRRLYARAPLAGGPTTLPKLWYVRPDNTLEDSIAWRGFDRLTFWQSVFCMALKQTTHLASEEAMAKLLNAHVATPTPAAGTLAALVASLPAWGTFVEGLLWTPTRFVCVKTSAPGQVAAMEFSNQGFKQTPMATWLANENQSVVWSYRKFKSPKPMPATGLLSLP